MFAVVCCKEFGWTYQEYITQPKFFIDMIKLKWKTDNKIQREQEIKNRKRKS